MRSVCKYNGIRWIHDYQDACVDKLERFLRGDLNIKPLSTTSQTGASAGQISAHVHGSPGPVPNSNAISYHGSAF